MTLRPGPLLRLRRLAAFAAVALAACSGDRETGSASPTSTGTGPSDCPAGEAPLSDGGCLPAGWQPNGCAAGELWLASDESCLPAGQQAHGCAAGELWEEGVCVPAGIPADACSEGFEPDGNGGCEPVLPASGCGAGRIAVVGEATCRPVAPCGADPWGTIPTDGLTVFVDAAAPGPGDGSSSDPFPTIQAGIDGAAPGAIVAVAEGTYTEDLVIEGRAVRLWGRCPDRVEIAGSASAAAAVMVGEGADGSEIRSLAVRGEAEGVAVSGAASVVIAEVWIHDTASFGVDVFDAGPGTQTSARIRGCLVERTREQGIWLSGVDGVIDETVVRDTLPTPGGFHGWGVTVLEDETTFRRASMTLRSSVVERSAEVGVVAHAADAIIADTAVLDTLPGAGDSLGRGLVAQTYGGSPGTNMTLTDSVIDGAYDAGIMVSGSHLVASGVVVRHVHPSVDGGVHGSGIAVQHDTSTGLGSTVELRHSLVEQASDVAILVGASDVLIEGVWVRDVRQLPDGTMGRGMALQRDTFGNLPATVAVRGSVIEACRDVGVFVEAAEVSLEGVAIRDIAPRASDDDYGWGVYAQDSGASLARASLSVSTSLVERAHGMGILVAGSDAELEGVRVRDIAPRAKDLLFGRGLNFQDNDGTGQRADVVVRSSVVERNREVGLLVGGADAWLEAVVVRDTQPGPVLGSPGRGLVVQINPETGAPASATVRQSLVERSHDVGLMSAGAEVLLESSLVRETAPRAIDGAFGDGVAVSHLGVPASAEVHHCRIEQSARGGIASFSGRVLLEGSAIICNDIDLNGETVEAVPYDFTDLGGNSCGCPAAQSMCRVLTSNLEPPEAMVVD